MGKSNFTFHIQCRDCEAELQILDPVESVEAFPSTIEYTSGKRHEGLKRIVMLHVPDVCPSCRNLKVVPR